MQAGGKRTSACGMIFEDGLHTCFWRMPFIIRYLNWLHYFCRMTEFSCFVKNTGILIAWLFVIQVNCVNGQQAPPKYVPPETRILFVFDASQSMAGIWQKESKIQIARQVLIHLIDSLEKFPNIKMALRVYGHQSPVPPQDCSDTRLEVPFAEGNAGKIRQELRYIVPKGTTPIAASLERAATDFPADCSNCRNIIMLITDGTEACDGDPCEVSADLQRRGIVLRPFVIGIGIDENFNQTFQCIGTYYNASHEEKLSEIMDVVITMALDATTAQINLLDRQGNPSETNVNLTLFDSFSGKVRYNYIHTLNSKGLPDTLILDPLPVYRLRVNTLPPVEVDGLKLVSGKHTILAAVTPQGTLRITSSDPQAHREVFCLVRQEGMSSTLHVQQMHEGVKYLTGKYDLEILSLPRIIKKSVEVKQNSTTEVEIPRPGQVTLLRNAPGFGSIYLLAGSNQQEWVCNLNETAKSESLQLQPGKYRVVFRAKNARLTLYSVNRTFEIRPGGTEVVNLY